MDELGCLGGSFGLQGILKDTYLGQKSRQLGSPGGDQVHLFDELVLGTPLLRLIQKLVEDISSFLTDPPRWILFGLGLVRLTYCPRRFD